MPDHLLQPRKEGKDKKKKKVTHCSLPQASNPTVVSLNSPSTSSQPVPIFSSGLPPTRMQKLFEVLSVGNAKAPKAIGEINKNIRCLSVSHAVVSNSATPWTVACQAPLSMGFLQARIMEWVGIPFSRGSAQTRDQTRVSCTARRFFTTELHSTEYLKIP